MSLGGGDQLARGAKSAVFPSNSHISDEKWESIFGKRKTESHRLEAECEIFKAVMKKKKKSSAK